MKVILSIKPEFANKIFDGTKKFEFRRRVHKNDQVTSVIVYASAPISKVIGEFEIGDVLHEELSSLWNITNEFSGISETYYREYFKGKNKGYAISVRKAELYKNPLCIQEAFGIHPPQSFAYAKVS
ncbi:putative transcriptional regulator [Roseivirga pacifica]|uniref:Predicted transcriptional regulator, contains an HTH and PUA-like domains n=1 Tax=Roseivirga pacifica TaxID=1267423 RepID=A0A1I0MFL4_9BACT|nr:ASCH domain-containing protein [Roseivirga pacifica]RKQ50345.1 putative transcriptional regulator [Roseivirga pacifica]SEV86908.1 Predicted transcriptional regulator, contains an HTH and PUA-like domains [Roseivirga pacifica]